MKRLLGLIALAGLASSAVPSAHSQNLLINGNLDLTSAHVIVDNAPAGAGPEDFYLPKPQNWVNEGSRAITGPYEDEMSSEPWAGPAPTPVTTDGNANPPHPEGTGGPDGAVFFKGFSGNAQPNGPATGHLYQDVAATPGLKYVLTGWAGAEPNYLGGAELALEFLNSGGAEIGSATLDLVAAGLLTDNGQPFDYKQYMVMATAPAGATTVRARVSMLDALANPLGGGQAYVVDDFVLTAVPEPSTIGLGVASLLGFAALKRRR